MWVKEVWLMGIETQTTIDQKLGSVGVTVSGVYSYTRSTNESIYDNGNPNEKGKQLMLTPSTGPVAHSMWVTRILAVCYSFFYTVYNVLPFYIQKNRKKNEERRCFNKRIQA